MDNDIIVGLGGHIDHGKTTLIKALNGFDGDSLAEEKRRGITLDLSFSKLSLPSRNVAFIDVPGHSKLVKNMIAGAFGIDVLLLVVAANEGIMPQTLEHIHIADYLGIRQCVCVITKIDKLENLGELEVLKARIEGVFAHCDMQLFDILALSLAGAESAELARLKDVLDSIPKPERADLGLFLYYVDRSFSIRGAGCVVTGSVLSGQCEVGSKLYAYHAGKEVGIRGIEIHDKPATHATPSHRVALNLTQISHTEISRGELISQKGYLRGFDTIDVGIFGTPRHNATYQLSIGSDRMSVKLRVLGRVKGAHAFGGRVMTLATLKCERAVYGVYSERFILRGGEAFAGGIESFEGAAFGESDEGEDFLVSAQGRGVDSIPCVRDSAKSEADSQLSENDLTTKHSAVVSQALGGAVEFTSASQDRACEPTLANSSATLESRRDSERPPQGFRRRSGIYSREPIPSVRDSANSSAIMGGVILNPIIEPLKKPARIELLGALARRDFPRSFELLSQIHKKGFGLVSATQRFALSHAQAVEIARGLSGVYVDDFALTIYPHATKEALKNQILDIFTRNAFALLSAQSLHTRLKWASLDFCQSALNELQREGHIERKQGLYVAKQCKISDVRIYLQEQLLARICEEHLTPRAPSHLYEELDLDKHAGDEALRTLCFAKKIVRLTHNCFVSAGALNEMLGIMRACIAEEGYVDVALLRERTGLSRKYLVGYLDYLDRFEDIVCVEHRRSFKYRH